MSTTTVYTCDRCKEVQKSRVETGGVPPLWKLVLTCEPIDSRTSYTVAQQHAEWCDACVKKLQVRRGLILADAPAPTHTLEDVVREIVRSELEAQSE